MWSTSSRIIVFPEDNVFIFLLSDLPKTDIHYVQVTYLVITSAPDAKNLLIKPYSAELFASIFRHLKLELPSQFPASNDEKYIFI